MRNYLVPGVLVLVILVLWLLLNPPHFWLNLTAEVEPTVLVGAQLVEQNNCRGCHRMGGRGALTAPGLDEVVRRQQEQDPALVILRLWLRDPKSIKPNTAMPAFRLSDSQIEAILLYLQEQAAASAG